MREEQKKFAHPNVRFLYKAEDNAKQKSVFVLIVKTHPILEGGEFGLGVFKLKLVDQLLNDGTKTFVRGERNRP